MLKFNLKSEDSIETWSAKIENFTTIIKGIGMWKLFPILAPDSWNEHYVSDFIFEIVYIHCKDNLLNWAAALYDRVPTASPISDFTSLVDNDYDAVTLCVGLMLSNKIT